MKKLILLLVGLFICVMTYAAQKYYIEHSVNDETFIINGEVFKAKTYCFGMNEGDAVIFIEGSPNGVCVSAKIYNLRTEKTCNVWCE